MINKNDRILYFDIETSPVLAAVWGPGKQYVSIDNVVKDRKIISIGYMWEGDNKPTVITLDLNKHKLDKYDDDADKAMLIKFMKQVNKAQMLIAHNGRRFDIARIRARLVKYDLDDMPPVLFDDSYSFTKNIGFTSHKLDYLSKALGYGQKLKTGLDLWLNIFWKKDKKALKEMAKYNAQDVLLLAKVYRKLRRYGKSQLNIASSRGDDSACPKCGSGYKMDGHVVRGLARYQQYACISKDCGYKFRDGVNTRKSSAHTPRGIK